MNYRLDVITKIRSKKIIIDRGFTSPCWEWTGKLNIKGYGLTTYKGVGKTVHRLFYRLNNLETFKKELMVCHKCNNRKCFNLEHLYQGTALDNTVDMIKINNHHNKRKTLCTKGHELSGDNLYIKPSGERCCKICKRVSSWLYYVNNR